MTHQVPVGRNIELKFRVKDLAAMTKAAESIADSTPKILDQVDTFFYCADGRLKLREFGNGRGELIHYRREDARGPVESSYLLLSVDQPRELLGVLLRAPGSHGTVSKRRTLYRQGRTRIHIDEVRGLGDFIEIEVVMAAGEAKEAGIEATGQLARQLQLSDAKAVEGSYLDLLGSPG